MDMVGGLNPSEKYKFVSWDDENPTWMEKKHAPTHSPVMDVATLEDVPMD